MWITLKEYIKLKVSFLSASLVDVANNVSDAIDSKLKKKKKAKKANLAVSGDILDFEDSIDDPKDQTRFQRKKLDMDGLIQNTDRVKKSSTMMKQQRPNLDLE